MDRSYPVKQGCPRDQVEELIDQLLLSYEQHGRGNSTKELPTALRKDLTDFGLSVRNGKDVRSALPLVLSRAVVGSGDVRSKNRREAKRDAVRRGNPTRPRISLRTGSSA